MTLAERMAAALPSYEIGQELGRGAWGVVVAGTHRELGRPVAIKELNLNAAGDPSTRQRFQSEARLLASFDHPHIVPIFDFVVRDDICLLVMEQLSGGTVWSRFTSNGFTMDGACSAVLAACLALDYAHRKGILHRDIKPDNLMFTASSTLKVTDFGIAKVMGGAQGTATRAGEVLGTPAYMSPEQAMGKELKPATDVYSLGILLYELLAGRLPFVDESNNPISLLYKHVHEAPPPLTQLAPMVPPALASVVMQSLAKDPTARFASAEAFGVAIAEATTSAWGPGWVGRSGVSVVASGPIAERLTGRGTAQTPRVEPRQSGSTSQTVVQAAVPLVRPPTYPGTAPNPVMTPPGSYGQPAIPSPTEPNPAYASGSYTPPPIQTGPQNVAPPVATGRVGGDWNYNVANTQPPPKKSKAWIAILAVVILLALIGIAVAIASSGSKGDTPTSGDSSLAASTNTTEAESTTVVPTTAAPQVTTPVTPLSVPDFGFGSSGTAPFASLSSDQLKLALGAIGPQEPIGQEAGTYRCSNGACNGQAFTLAPDSTYTFGGTSGSVYKTSFQNETVMILIDGDLHGSFGGVESNQLLFPIFGSTGGQATFTK